MNNYSAYTFDQLHDELDVLDPVKHAKEIAAIRLEIEKKAPYQAPETEEGSSVLFLGSIGCAFLGHRDPRHNGSYEATYFLLVVLPIFPLFSARIYTSDEETAGGRVRAQRFNFERLPVNWAQARNVYLAAYGTLAIAAGIVWLLKASGVIDL